MRRHTRGGRARPALTKRFVAVLALVSALAVIVSAIVFLRTNVITSYQMPMKVQIVAQGRIGFDLNTEVVQFGKMRPGGENTRYFNVTNDKDVPVKVVLKASGEMAPWVVFTPPTRILQPHVSETITAACVPPRNTRDGNYTGTLQVFFMKP
jgi:hypothetical protein